MPFDHPVNRVAISLRRDIDAYGSILNQQGSVDDFSRSSNEVLDNQTEHMRTLPSDTDAEPANGFHHRTTDRRAFASPGWAVARPHPRDAWATVELSSDARSRTRDRVAFVGAFLRPTPWLWTFGDDIASGTRANGGAAAHGGLGSRPMGI